MYTFRFIALLALLSLLSISRQSNIVCADDNSVLSGEIQMEQDDKKADSYSDTEAQALEVFEKLNEFTNSKDLSKIPTNWSLSDNLLVHLNAYYLYCSTNRGVCPHVLDAILEIDLINSRRDRKTACPNMIKFWKLWLNNDMEKRHQYQVKTGYIQQTTDFKNTVRPKYLKCQATLESIAKLESADDTYYSERYQENSSINKAIENTLKDLKQAKESKINLLVVSGTKK